MFDIIYEYVDENKGKILLFFLFLILFCSIYFIISAAYENKENFINGVISGEITDKRIETVRDFFGRRTTEYRIYVGYEYKKKNREKIFVVSENTYLSYKIGEFFDSQDFRTAPLETEKEPPDNLPVLQG